MITGKEANKVLGEVVKLLIAKKKQTGQYNVAINHKGLDYDMAITTFDDKPFERKHVLITAYAPGTIGMSYTPLTLEPIKCGYTKKEVDKMLDAHENARKNTLRELRLKRST